MLKVDLRILATYLEIQVFSPERIVSAVRISEKIVSRTIYVSTLLVNVCIAPLHCSFKDCKKPGDILKQDMWTSKV